MEVAGGFVLAWSFAAGVAAVVVFGVVVLVDLVACWLYLAGSKRDWSMSRSSSGLRADGLRVMRNVC